MHRNADTDRGHRARHTGRRASGCARLLPPTADVAAPQVSVSRGQAAGECGIVVERSQGRYAIRRADGVTMTGLVRARLTPAEDDAASAVAVGGQACGGEARCGVQAEGDGKEEEEAERSEDTVVVIDGVQRLEQEEQEEGGGEEAGGGAAASRDPSRLARRGGSSKRKAGQASRACGAGWGGRRRHT